MKIIYCFIVFLMPSLIFSQDAIPTTAINGTYHLLEAERGSATKLFQYGELNGVKMLATAACTQCMPATYTYQEEDSKDIGMPIFYNSIGLYMITYDENSFVMVMPSIKGEGDWTNTIS